jgi:hypothetical protein
MDGGEVSAVNDCRIEAVVEYFVVGGLIDDDAPASVIDEGVVPIEQCNAGGGASPTNESQAIQPFILAPRSAGRRDAPPVRPSPTSEAKQSRGKPF